MNLLFGNALPWERCALGTFCHTRCACVFRGWGRVGHGGHGTCQTTPCSPPDSDAQRSCIGTPRDGANNAPLPGIPTRSDVRVANFEPLGFSSRSCRSTGRLMRSLAPWWGEADLRLPPFFPAETRRVAAASAGFSGRGQDRSYVYRSYALEQRADYQTQLDSDLQ